MARKKLHVSKRTTATKTVGKGKTSKVGNTNVRDGKAGVPSGNKHILGENAEVKLGKTVVPDDNVFHNSNAAAVVAVSTAGNNNKRGGVDDRSKFQLNASVEVHLEWSKEEFAAIIKKIDSLTDLNEFAYGSRKRNEEIDNLRTTLRIIADDTRNSNVEAYNGSWHDFERFDNMMSDLRFTNDPHSDILDWLRPFTF